MGREGGRVGESSEVEGGREGGMERQEGRVGGEIARYIQRRDLLEEQVIP